MLGRRHPRERLVEQDLCDEFHTHRGDVRLALFELEKIGIVRRIPNRGAVVRDLSPEEVSGIYDVREMLEVMALRILPLPIPAKALATLEALQRQHSDAVDAGDFLTVHYSNVQFHRTLFSLCGNRMSDRNDREPGTKGLEHSILRPCPGGCAEQLPARPRRDDPGFAQPAPGGADQAGTAPPEAGRAGVYPRLRPTVRRTQARDEAR